MRKYIKYIGLFVISFCFMIGLFAFPNVEAKAEETVDNIDAVFDYYVELNEDKIFTYNNESFKPIYACEDYETLTFSYKKIVNGGEQTFTGVPKNVGDYKVYISYTNTNDNLLNREGEFDYKIVKRDIKIRGYSKSFVYGDDITFLASDFYFIDETTLAEGDTFEDLHFLNNIKWYLSSNSLIKNSKNVGEHKLDRIAINETVGQPEGFNRNYYLKSLVASFDMYGKNISINLTAKSDKLFNQNQNKIYYGDKIITEYEVLSGEVSAGDDLKDYFKLTINNISNSDVEDFDPQKCYDQGRYKLKVQTIGNGNYNVSAIDVDITIQRLMVNLQLQGKVVYGDELKNSCVTITNEDSIVLPFTMDDLNLNFKVNATKLKVNQNYKLALEDNYNKNYEVFIDPFENSLQVTPRPITLRILEKELIYGESLTTIGENRIDCEIIHNSYGYNDDQNDLFLQCDVQSKTPKHLTVKYDAEGKVDKYICNFTANSENYNVTFENNNTKILKINPKNISLTIIPSKLNVHYGEKVSVSYVVDNESLCYADRDKDLVTALGIVNNHNKTKIGTYKINEIDLTNKNYNIVSFIDGQYNIIAKPITISINTYKVVDGNEKLTNSFYYGETPIFKPVLFTGQSLEYGETLEDLKIDCELKSKLVDPKVSITVKCNGEKSSNYDITTNDSYISIIPKPVTFKIKDVEVVFGEPLEKDFGVTLVEGYKMAYGEEINILEVKYKYTPDANVDDSPVILNAYTENKNYDCTFLSGKLTMVPRPMFIKILDKTTEYRTPIALKDSDFIVDTDKCKFAFQDKKSSLALSFRHDGDKKLTILDDIAEYDLYAVSNNSNYVIKCIHGKHKIIPKTLVIKLSNVKKIFGDRDGEYLIKPIPDVVFTGHVSREKGESPGKYKIVQGTLDAGKNYKIEFKEAYMVIEEEFPPIFYAGFVFVGLGFAFMLIEIIRFIRGARIF